MDGVAIFVPVIVLVLTFVLYDVVKPLIASRRAAAAPGAAVIGTAVPVEPVADWAERAYAALSQQLADERGDHARCDALLRAHGIPVPHD